MRAPIVLTAAVLMLAGCSQPKPLYVDGAWVRLAAVPGQPGAGYFTVHGGAQPATLIAVSADTAIGAAMHRSMATGASAGAGQGPSTGSGQGMTTMAPIARLPIPARGVVRFAPGGLHVMFSGINPGIKRGSTMHLTFSFADGTRIVQDASVVAAGDPPPQ